MKFRLSPFLVTATTGIWLASIVLPACNKTNNSKNSTLDTANSTITTILKASTTATYFYYAMTRTHLDSLFNTTGNLASQGFTVFVPTDSAFGASGITRSILNSMTDSALKRIVLYETIQQYLRSSNVTNPNSPFQTADGETVFLTNNSRFFINGIPVSERDIITKNGVIQFIRNSVALPPLGDLFQIINSDTSFTYFAAALNRVDSFFINYPPFNMVLKSARGSTTIFAPNNHAFQINGYPNIDAINTADQNYLGELIANHIVHDRLLFTSDIYNDLRVNTYLGNSSILFNSSGSTLQVTGNSNNVPANILKANIMATNGVLFTIDQVLKP